MSPTPAWLHCDVCVCLHVCLVAWNNLPTISNEDMQMFWKIECAYWHVPYSGKLSREKTFVNWWKIWFSRRKLSCIATKLRNSHKFSPSKVFRYTVLQLSHVKGYCQLVVLAWKELGIKMTHAECIFNMSHLSARMTTYSVMGMLRVWPSCNKATCESKLAAECKGASLLQTSAVNEWRARQLIHSRKFCC